jgi:hypothetical protein
MSEEPEEDPFESNRVKREPRNMLSYDSFGDTIIDDKEWNSTTYDLIAEGINKGETPEGAALQAGLPISKFRDWMHIESFNMMIQGLVASHRSKLRKEIEDDIEIIYLPKERVNAKIKHAERIDPDYGMKRIEIDDKKSAVPDPVGSLDQEGLDMLRAAKEAANGED